MGGGMTKIANTVTLLAIVSKDDRAWLKPRLDPDGTHVVVGSMLHNDGEIRAQWLLKFTGEDEPHYAQLGIGIADFNRLNEVEVPA
jgi:hypothetical protein